MLFSEPFIPEDRTQNHEPRSMFGSITVDHKQFAEMVHHVVERSRNSAASAEINYPPPVAKTLDQLQTPQSDDENELIRYRFLCRAGAVLLCGPTGIGKSSFAMQLAIHWSLGLSFVGLAAARPIKSLILSAENDEGDLCEMRDGAVASMALNDEQRAQACTNVLVAREKLRTGVNFITNCVRPLVEKHRPDLLWIDPALAYLGGDTSSQRDVSAFLRNGLNPLLEEFNCSCIILHHTNKPPTNKKDRQAQTELIASEHAYAASGSIEWANWARGVLTIRVTKDPNVYELYAGKRGARLRWKDQNDQSVFKRAIGWSKEQGLIYWREITDYWEANPTTTEPSQHQITVNQVCEQLSDDGLTSKEWETRSIEALGISESTYHRARRSLIKTKRVYRENDLWKCA